MGFQLLLILQKSYACSLHEGVTLGADGLQIHGQGRSNFLKEMDDSGELIDSCITWLGFRDGQSCWEEHWGPRDVQTRVRTGELHADREGKETGREKERQTERKRGKK
jgi:hypothetical protein